MTGERPATLDRFEDRLLRQLHEELAIRPTPQPASPGRPHRQPRRLLIGAGSLAAAGVAALVAALAVSTAAPAYAIHSRPDGSFVVVLDGTAEQDLNAVERELRSRGASIELVAKSLDCLDVLAPPDPSLPAEPHGPLPAPPPTGMFPWFDAFEAVSGAERRNPVNGDRLRSHEWAFTVRPDAIPPGQVLWVAVNGPGVPGAGLVTVAGFAAAGAGPPRLCSTR
jgi:hypothetical protein